MKWNTVELKKPIKVTIYDGLRPACAAKLLALNYYLGKNGGILQVKATVLSEGYGKEMVDLCDVHNNLWK